MIPTYRKHSSGQARVVINGRCFYLGKYGSKASKRRYDALVAEWLASSRSSSFGLQPETLTLSHLMLDYLRHCKRHYVKGPNSEYAPTKQVLRKVRHLYADVPASEFGPAQFKAVRQLLIDSESGHKKRADDPRPPKKLSRSYINAQMKRVARMFRWGAAEGLVSPDVYNALRLIPSLQRGRTTARETKRVQPVDEALVTVTLSFCSPVVADMIRVQLLTGCRPSEVCMLTPGMIDRKGEVWTARLESHKTAHHGRERIIYFGPQAQQILMPYLLRPANAALFSPRESEAKRRASRTAERKTPRNAGNRPGTNRKAKPRRKAGACYDTHSYRRAIYYACDKGKLQRWAPNQLRHTAGTKIRSMFGLDAAAKILGHSEVGVTQIYAEMDHAKATDVAWRIG